jgi:hypothetical protein
LPFQHTESGIDFTYLVAILISLAVGFSGSLLFVISRGRSYWRLVVSTLIATVIADFSLLIDWSRSDEITASFLLTDAAFFTGYGLVACTLGTLPVVALRGVYRMAQARDARSEVG